MKLLLAVTLGLSAGSAPAFAGPVPPVRGTFYRGIGADPTSLSPILITDGAAQTVLGYVVESLLEQDMDTLEWVPALASEWNTSSDGREITFKLRPGLRWHDGKPVTSADVKFSFDVYSEGGFHAPWVQATLTGIESASIIDPLTTRFKIKQARFKNFETLATLPVLPEHFYRSAPPTDPKFNRELVGTGPYRLTEWVRGQRLVLERIPSGEYWGDKVPYQSIRNRFAKVVLRIVSDPIVQLEMLKKGDLDYIGLSPEFYATKTSGPEWGTKLIAVKASSDSPATYSYSMIAWNCGNELFSDKRVRHALSMLMDRDRLIEKFGYGLIEKAKGPLGNRSPASSSKVIPVAYDPPGAMALLKAAGWAIGERGMTKSINGSERLFEFTVIYAAQDFERILTPVVEEMRKVGIQMRLKRVDYNALIKLATEHRYEGVSFRNGIGDPDPDLSVWHTESGTYLGKYLNPELDKLVEKVRTALDPVKRRSYQHQFDEQVAEDGPISFLFSPKYELYARSARIKTLGDTFRYGIDLRTWWVE